MTQPFATAFGAGLKVFVDQEDPENTVVVYTYHPFTEEDGRP